MAFEPSDPPASLPSSNDSPWVILKFGGTSVSSLACWERIAKILRERLSDGLRPLVVCSALSQVSNQLEQAIEQALSGDDPVEALDTLEQRHQGLARELTCSDADEAIARAFDRLREQLAAVAATREASPRLRAEILSVGELLSTRLGAAWLAAQGIAARWLDARELLTADDAGDDVHRQYLSATCTPSAQDGRRLAERLARQPERVLITQGFLVGTGQGETALLGRGGSDTSATYLGQQLRAERVEIWTDVPGLFSADPRRVPDARRLRRVGYDEVIELATRGAKVLHPRSLVPARAAGIPIEIRCTADPASRGTIISDDFRVEEPAGLAISSRQGMVIVNMDVELSWQQPGVIAELTACFARRGLSIDSITSSQTRVTVSLDPSANPLDADLIDGLLKDLRAYARPTVISPVASVSVIGTHLRRVLHGMPSLLRELETREVYLLAHAANDHSLTFVVDESESDELVRALHVDLLRLEASSPDGDSASFAAHPGHADFERDDCVKSEFDRDDRERDDLEKDDFENVS